MCAKELYVSYYTTLHSCSKFGLQNNLSPENKSRPYQQNEI
jgi:hypothetical protein